MEMLGGSGMKCSIFILVQVSLFIEVVIFWRRKAFLRHRRQIRIKEWIHNSLTSHMHNERGFPYSHLLCY